MKPRPFDYVRPDTVEEALEVLAGYGEDARVLAGGQTLVAMLNLRLVEAKVIVDISRLTELNSIRVHVGALEVGAAVTQNKLLAWPELSTRAPLLAQMLPFVGHFQTRNRGTVCGSIAHADPSSELPLALTMLDGEVVLRSKRATRTLKAREFQTGMLTTARQPDELIVSARFSLAPGKTAFREIARRHGDFAIVAVAARRLHGSHIRLGIGGADPKPFIRDVDAGEGTGFEDLVRALDPYEDMHASPRLRRDLVRNIAPLVAAEALA
jgi:2-furoyl-CoA dehydrogenase FAD binding subunit